MIDIELVYNLSIHKLHNFQTTRRDSDGLRKLVLLNNFVYEKFTSPEPDVDLLEWSEEDIKKDEESWLDSCLDELDEDDYVHVNVKPLEQQHQPTVASFSIDPYDDPRHYEDHYVQDNDAMEYENHSHERQLSTKDIDDVIIPHDLLHLPFFDPGDNFHMDIEHENNNNNYNNNNDNDDDYLMDTCNSPSQDDDMNITNIENSSEKLTCEKGFHPYWKDNSIIGHPSSRSFGIPKIFHKYRFDQGIDSSSPRRISPPNAVLELLQSNYLYQSLESRRSKDDLDILYSLAPKDLDRGILMDMISMLEYYGNKANHNITKKSNSSEINDIWFMDNNHRLN
ncbi:hypothetical protein RclHR1_17510001 [Rhizophagus clarus]|uniref:Uncharacterized protein n=1 Tax=Rhizophagus clarus TaxID=94130 RepID=A0A2Z6QP74_9GLOM|nr:hypothetical protein RclHR1_17510001 [Rhizophagus clarus]GES90595.1 hypothetical protein GLOIN_2v1570985 [Rhizophagus clarus]